MQQYSIFFLIFNSHKLDLLNFYLSKKEITLAFLIMTSYHYALEVTTLEKLKKVINSSTLNSNF